MIPDFKTAEERSAWIVKHADMFTAVRFKGRGEYERHEFKNLPAAEKAAGRMANEHNGRYLIYACAGIYDTYVKAVHPQEG